MDTLCTYFILSALHSQHEIQNIVMSIGDCRNTEIHGQDRRKIMFPFIFYFSTRWPIFHLFCIPLAGTSFSYSTGRYFGFYLQLNLFSIAEVFSRPPASSHHTTWRPHNRAQWRWVFTLTTDRWLQLWIKKDFLFLALFPLMFCEGIDGNSTYSWRQMLLHPPRWKTFSLLMFAIRFVITELFHTPTNNDWILCLLIHVILIVF